MKKTMIVFAGIAALAGLDLVAQREPVEPAPVPVITKEGAAVEQTSPGTKPSAVLVDSFDGLGVGFEGPQGTYTGRSPSDTSIAVGPDHVVHIVNSRLAVFTKKGARYETTGKVLYGPVATNQMFAGLGGVCEARNNGDAVVRYDQLAKRWLIVMPIFGRIQPGQFKVAGERPRPARSGKRPRRDNCAVKGQAATPGPAVAPPPNPVQPPPPAGRGQRGQPPAPGQPPPPPPAGTYAMCYAISTTSDPLGPYYRYAFDRPLFPDYPRPAVWPDGYYNPTSTGDDVIQKHACVVDRNRMLKGEPATEQCVIIDGVNFLNNADIDGQALPPAGAPNIIMAAGGTQLKKVFEDDGIYAWTFHVDWDTPANTKVVGPNEDSGRAVPLSLQRPVDQLRAAAGHRSPARRAGRQDHAAGRLSPRRTARVDRRVAFGRDESRRRRRPLVRVPSRQETAARPLPARHLRA